MEESKASRKAKKEEELDADVLPTNGLYNLDGHLFYHAYVQNLTKAQYKRAEDHGINLRSKKGFTLEECIRIFKNWHQYATENNMFLERALDYLTAKKADKHIIQHQEDNHFWVKLCNGLPHRSGVRIKTRAQQMMTDAFMKELDWSRLDEQIQQKYFQYETYDEVTMQKTQKLMEKGYPASYVAEVLDVPVTRAINMASKIKNLEGRDDRAMINSLFDSAVHFGLDFSKLQRCVIIGDEFYLDRLRKDVKLDELSLKLQISEHRCKELLKTLLKSILEKYQRHLNETNSEDDAWEAALQEFSDKPPIEEHQLYKALEIFCKHMGKEDTKMDLRSDEELAKLIKSNGITGFQCYRPEFRYIYQRICEEMMRPLQKGLFEHLRRDFRLQLKLHCLLWSYRKLEVWDKFIVPEGKTRYEVVLVSEIANPLISKMTKKFLKNEKVVEWIMDIRSTKHRRNAATRRLEAGVEAFILYTYQKTSGEFKFPAKLSHLVSPDITIKSILSEVLDPDNSEFLSMKRVRNIVEDASGNKILVKLKNKYIVKREEDETSDDDSDPEEAENLVEHSQQMKSRAGEERRREIDSVLEKADQSNIRKKFLNQEEEDEIWLSEELYRQKKVLTSAAKRLAEQRRVCSNEFIETDDSSSDEETEKKNDVEEEEKSSDEDLDDDTKYSEYAENQDSSDFAVDYDAYEEDSDDSEIPEFAAQNSEDVEIPEEDSEPAPTNESLERKREDSDGVETSQEAPSTSEDVTEKKKKKKRKHRDSDLSGYPGSIEEEVPAPEDDASVDSEHVNTKKKKKKKRNRQDSEQPEDVPTTSEDAKALGDPGILDDSDDVVAEKKKKKKKRKHRDSELMEEVVESMESLNAPEDVTLEKPKKKKRKHRDSDKLDEVNAPEDVPSTSEETVTKKKKKHKKHRREEED